MYQCACAFACTSLKWELICGNYSEMLQQCVNRDSSWKKTKLRLVSSTVLLKWSMLNPISLLLYSVPLGSITFFFLLGCFQGKEICLILACHVISYFWHAVGLYWWNSAFSVCLVKPVSGMKELELFHIWEFCVLWDVPLNRPHSLLKFLFWEL